MNDSVVAGAMIQRLLGYVEAFLGPAPPFTFSYENYDPRSLSSARVYVTPTGRFLNLNQTSFVRRLRGKNYLELVLTGLHELIHPYHIQACAQLAGFPLGEVFCQRPIDSGVVFAPEEDYYSWIEATAVMLSLNMLLELDLANELGPLIGEIFGRRGRRAFENQLYDGLDLVASRICEEVCRFDHITGQSWAVSVYAPWLPGDIAQGAELIRRVVEQVLTHSFPVMPPYNARRATGLYYCGQILAKGRMDLATLTLTPLTLAELMSLAA